MVEQSMASEYYSNKTVLVTGGGGSIGGELSKQLAGMCPRKLVIFDIYENNAYMIGNDIAALYPRADVEILIGSVRDRSRVFEIFEKYEPDVVFHAAAHKHVPLMEASPAEAVKNNVFGTLNVAEAASAFSCEKFVLISTDKAVSPSSVMGATKRLCEMLVFSMNIESETAFSCVRFGNVMASAGSVIPLFRRQISAGGPVTVTHPDVTRFFMSVSEAVTLVLYAGVMSYGGEIFVLDMGESVNIDSLARQMIRSAGHVPDVDVRIVYTGLREGEKLTEIDLLDDSDLVKTASERIYVKYSRDRICNVSETLGNLRLATEAHNGDVRAALKAVVHDYNY